MNDNWPAATEATTDAAITALYTLVEAHGVKAIPGMIGALVNWAVVNSATTQMGRCLATAVEALPAIDALWRG